jgi:hypothetical protein
MDEVVMPHDPKTQEEFDALIAALLRTTRALKESVVKEEGGPADTIPMLHWEAPSGGIVVGLPGGTEPLDVVVLALLVDHGRPNWVGLVSDAFCRPGGESSLARGQLAYEFGEGNMGVEEALLVQVSTPLFAGGARLKYTYEDGRLVFHEDPPDEAVHIQAGWVPECLALAFGPIPTPGPGYKSPFTA